ncbi:hypothetical protein CBS101457_001728 [Exobasidium rhododendri]|nr:hypothetical protein CBS101457_001728 [Exobasidium rhododendri]
MQCDVEENIDEIFASIWRQSSCGRDQARGARVEQLTPPASPTRFHFPPSPYRALPRSRASDITPRHHVSKKSASAFKLFISSHVFTSWLQPRDRQKDRKETRAEPDGAFSDQSHSFFEFGSSQESLLIDCSTSSSVCRSKQQLSFTTPLRVPTSSTPPRARQKPATHHTASHYRDGNSSFSSVFYASEPCQAFLTGSHEVDHSQPIASPPTPTTPSRKRDQRSSPSLPPPFPPPGEDLPALPRAPNPYIHYL